MLRSSLASCMWTPSNTWFLEPTRILNPNGISIGSAVYAQLTAVSLYFTVGRPFPIKIAPSYGDLDPHLYGVLWPTRVLKSNGVWIGSAIFWGLTMVIDQQTDRLTDHATRSVTIAVIYTEFWLQGGVLQLLGGVHNKCEISNFV